MPKANLKTLKDSDTANKTILYRSPYDIGTKLENGKYVIKDDSRIKATLETLTYLLSNNCKIVIITYVKRPQGVYEEALSTKPHAQKLSELLDRPVRHIPECIGDQVTQAKRSLNPGELLMLENTRFHFEEDLEDDLFAKQLCEGCDFIVFDGFPQAHRKHASTTGILKHLPSCIGFYFEKEYNNLFNIIETPEHPFTIIIGGAKVSDKVGAIKNLYKKADIFLVGGGVANVFLSANGKDMQSSYLEDVFIDIAHGIEKNWVDEARDILLTPSLNHSYHNYEISISAPLTKIFQPYDLIISNSLENPVEANTIEIYNQQSLPFGWAALDIGPKTNQIFKEIILQSKTIFWNGPMGLFEDARFAEGTKQVALAINEAFDNGVTTFIGGGDTIEAVNKYADPSKVTYVSLAGGATLEMLAGKEFPVLQYLQTSDAIQLS